MILRGIEYGNVFGASGVQGFFDEGYWFHKPWQGFGLDFRGMTFGGKTVLLNERRGNMLLRPDHKPRDWFPDCVVVQPLAGQMLNAVGLSNHGLLSVLNTGRLQQRRQPFFLSFMSVAGTKAERLTEMRAAAGILRRRKQQFQAPFFLQVNLSCPTSGHDPAELISEAVEMLETARFADVALMPKFSIASAPVEAILELGKHPACDAICVSNTIPFGWPGINWKKVWGTDVSPLQKYGGGGLSGRYLKPLVCDWIARLRDAGFTKPINGGGGIFSTEDISDYCEAGANSCFLGSVVPLRPWRVQSLIRYANGLYWRK
jgi:dihydroorotate dehydrogenase